MKQFLVIVFVLCSIQLNSIIIDKNDYGWSPGSQRNYLADHWLTTSTDLTPGSGKVWNFATPTYGYENNIFASCSNIATYPNATLYKTYSAEVGSPAAGTTYYQETVDDYLSLGGYSSVDLVWTPGIPSGLPHYLNKTWQGNYQYSSIQGQGEYTISGDVIAEGLITTHWGTHAALLVHYHYQYSTSFSYDSYQWETKEYGIEAFAYTLAGGKLYVLNEAEPNIVANDDMIASPTIPAVTVFPNPSRDIVNLQVSTKLPGNLDVSIYNIKGELVHQEKQTASKTIVWNGKNKNQEKVKPGVYFYRINVGKQTATGKFVIVQ